VNNRQLERMSQERFARQLFDDLVIVDRRQLAGITWAERAKVRAEAE